MSGMAAGGGVRLPLIPVDAWTHPCGCKDFIERTSYGVNTGRAFCSRHSIVRPQRDEPEWPVLMLVYPSPPKNP